MFSFYLALYAPSIVRHSVLFFSLCHCPIVTHPKFLLLSLLSKQVPRRADVITEHHRKAADITTFPPFVAMSDWDDMCTDALLCGSDSDTEQAQPANAAAGPSTTAPRASGGFAAAGRAHPLTFHDLYVGAVIVRRPPEDSPLFGGPSSVAAAPLQSAVLRRPQGRDLLAALRSNAAQPAAVAAAAVAAAVAAPPPPPPRSAAGVDWSVTLSGEYVTEAEGAGISAQQLYSLAQRMLVVIALSPADHAAVLANAAGDVTYRVCNFGQPTASSSTPFPSGEVNSKADGSGSSSNSGIGTFHRAGAVEEGLFARWRSGGEAGLADFRAVLASEGIAPEEKGAGGPVVGEKRPREAGATTIADALAGPAAAAAAAGASGAAAQWWAVKGLLVRFVPQGPTGEADPRFGKKGSIVECSKRDGRVTLRLEEGGDPPTFSIVRCGMADVDTVIPKVGGRVMVLRADLAGEITTVAARGKDPASGDPLVTVEVDGERVVLKAEEVCQLA